MSVDVVFSGGELKDPHDVYVKRNSDVSDTFDVRKALESIDRESAG